MIRAKCLSEVEQAIKNEKPWIIIGAGSGYKFYFA